VTVSAGVAIDTGQGSVAALLRRADGALYRAKHEGRDRVCADS
jgi:PleD family two-component response regulator